MTLPARLRTALALGAALLPLHALAIDAGFVLDQAAKSAKAIEAVPRSVGASIQVEADIAAFNALDALTPRYRPYRWTPPAPAADASPEAAVLTAHAVVLSAFAALDGAAILRDYAKSLAELPAGPAREAGVVLGRRAALAILQERSADLPGPRVEPPVHPAGPGVYVLTPGYPRQVGLEITQARPFALARVADLDPGPPPAIGDPAYVRDLAEVRAVGQARSQARTADQTAAAIFWNAGGFEDADLMRPVVARARLDALDTARLVALKDMAEFDAAIACFTFKHQYNRWRPYTALRDEATAGPSYDPLWMPLLQTHPHQDYPSGALTIVQAFATVLGTVGSGPLESLDESTGVRRSWESTTAMLDELAGARVWGGVHFRSASEAGRRLGAAVARSVMATQLLPLKP